MEVYIVGIIHNRHVTLVCQTNSSIPGLEVIAAVFTNKSSDCAKIIAIFPRACYSSLVTVACTGDSQYYCF